MKYLFRICLFLLTSCSPLYVIRAGWEEGKILAKRQSIEKLAQSEEIDSETKRKFQLVIAARDYAEEIGLKPKDSFTKYSDVERDNLLWVLSACDKTSFRPATWWFPIVGTVAYKGYFDQEDAIEEAKKFKEDGLDVYLRPSPAFSTLGWFNDPLLSTVMKYDDASLVNVVLHEILHNTVWISDNVYFNETLANAVGSYAAYSFFKKSGDEQNAQITIDRWNDELVFAQFLESTKEKLQAIYSDDSLSKDDKLVKREIAFMEARQSWSETSSKLKTKSYAKAADKLNNAAIVAMEIYLKSPESFEELYQASAQNIQTFIVNIKEVEKQLKNDDNPFEAIKLKIQQLK